MSNLQILLITCIILLVITITIIIILIVMHFNQIKKCYIDVNNLLIELIENDDAKLERINISGFDFKITSKNQVTYVCVINNPKCNEILINSKTKWQTKSSPQDEAIKFIDKVVDAMNVMINSEREVNKIFIIYPNARQLMIALNECEYAFVYPTTDVYGTKVFTYNRLVHTNEIKKI